MALLGSRPIVCFRKEQQTFLLLLISLVGMNPGVQDGTLVTVLSFLVLSAFLTAAVFEVKRLADQSSDEEHH
jgi:hypothetical protein